MLVNTIQPGGELKAIAVVPLTGAIRTEKRGEGEWTVKNNLR